MIFNLRFKAHYMNVRFDRVLNFDNLVSNF